MDIIGATAVAKTAADLVKSEHVLGKASDLMGMLFPYARTKQKAVEIYLKDIEKSDLPPETKVFMILNTKKTFKKMKNQNSIAEIAMDNAKHGTDFSEKSGVNEEWLDRFMDSAGFVSSEEMQLIWGKILANEFEKPGSTPPNMIRILSEFTAELATAFRYICSMRAAFFPIKDGEAETDKGISHVLVPYGKNEEEFLKELETLGVIRFSTMPGYISKGIETEEVLMFLGNELDVIEKHKKGEVPIGDVLLTSAGIALQSIIEDVKVKNYPDMVKKHMEYRGVKFAESHDFDFKLDNNLIEIFRKEN